MFYVYEWYVKSTGEIFYVGKGTRDRYKVIDRNALFCEKIQSNDCDVRIIKQFEKEEDAYTFEAAHIQELREQGQCSCNIQDGGFGGMASEWTQELRNKASEQNVMKADAQRQRMKENNPMKNPEIAMKANGKKRKPVVINGIEYASIKEASLALNVATSTISSWCVNGKNPQGILCHYKGQSPQVYNNTNTGKAKQVQYLDKIYSSAAAAAKANNVSSATMTRWCRQQRDSKGNVCRYITDERPQQETISQRSKGFFINDKYYSNKEEASRDLNLGVHTITSLLENKIQNDKYICRYDNQQPSQGSTDISTLEGSETNE